ncbi:MAG: citrate:proton symporter, partial [Sporomusa sp.]
SDASVVFNPIIPAMIAGIVWVLFACYYVGQKERLRLGITDFGDNVPTEHKFDGVGEDLSIKRPQLFWFNVIMTVLIIVGLLAEIMPMATIFVIGFAIAITVNYPNLKDQQERLKNYSAEVVTIVTLIFSAGCFTGILSGTKMVTEMSSFLVSMIPQSMGSLLPLIVAITSMPLSLVFPTDAYYFGVLPVVYEMAASIGIEPIQIGRAAVLGQMTTGFPLSPLAAATLVLISVAKVNLVEHQKFMFLWAFGTTIVMTIVAYLTGALTF